MVSEKKIKTLALQSATIEAAFTQAFPQRFNTYKLVDRATATYSETLEQKRAKEAAKKNEEEIAKDADQIIKNQEEDEKIIIKKKKNKKRSRKQKAEEKEALKFAKYQES